MRKKIKTPRPYLSYSQMSLWEKNPDEYKRIYFEGGEGFYNSAMELGSKLSEALEEDIHSDISIVEHGRIFLPAYAKKEYQLKVETEVCPLLSKLDTFSSRPLKFREYKTGKVPWTQGKVDKSMQITFYTYVIWRKYKKLPSPIHLDWLCTDPDKNYGMIKSFETTRTITDLIKFHVRIKKCWQGILEMSEL